MHISETSQLSALTRAATAQVDFHAPPQESPAARIEDLGASDSPHDGKRALSVFEAELHSKLKLKLNFESMTGSVTGSDDHAEGVANGALAAAKQMVDESPETATQSLVRFKAEVRNSAEFTRQHVADDIEPLDKAVSRIDSGLESLAQQTSTSRTATTTVLDVDTKIEQQSKIRIRTQEGDVVKLSFKYHDETSIEVNSRQDATGIWSKSEFDFGMKSSMKMSVDGDLSESELASIMNIVSHAEQISASFYSGDFESTAGSIGSMSAEYDQIASFGMKFQLEQETEVRYREASSVVRDAPPAAPVEHAAQRPKPATEALPKPTVEPVVQDQTLEQPVKPEPPAEAGGISDAISRFLRIVGEGFSQPGGDGKVTFHHSQSFKLSILQAVVNATEPAESQQDSQSFLGRIGDFIDASSALHDD